MANSLFHPEAQAEYDAALAWYQARSLQAARRFETEVDRVLGLIASGPDAFPQYDAEHRFAVLTRPRVIPQIIRTKVGDELKGDQREPSGDCHHAVP